MNFFLFFFPTPTITFLMVSPLCEMLPSDIYNNSKKFVASHFHHHYSIAVSEKSTSKNWAYFSMFLFVIFHSPVFLGNKLMKQLARSVEEKRRKKHSFILNLVLLKCHFQNFQKFPKMGSIKSVKFFSIIQ